jgi:hypothetical protein
MAQPITAIAARDESFSMAHFLSGHESPPSYTTVDFHRGKLKVEPIGLSRTNFGLHH